MLKDVIFTWKCFAYAIYVTVKTVQVIICVSTITKVTVAWFALTFSYCIFCDSRFIFAQIPKLVAYHRSAQCPMWV